jgi:hypothetical protein
MRSHLRLASAVGAATLSVIAVAPAMAGTPVAQAGANAVNIDVAGNANGSGDVTAKNDGTQETTTGKATPPLAVLGGQQVINAGVLAQEATARADGTSAACAGLTGDGGSVVAIGDSSCLSPGTPVNATLGALDLSGMVVADPDSPLGSINGATDQVIAQVAPVVTQAVDALSAQLGDLGVVAGFGVIEGRCTAQLGSAGGDATLADAGIRVQLPGQTVTLLTLPVNPKPNTHLTTNLSAVLNLVLDAVRTDLNESLDGQTAPLAAIIDPIQAQIVNNVVTQVETNLAPLEENILDVVLNRQIRATNDSIKVRALDLSVLPAPQAQLGTALVNLQIGNAACGPSGRIGAVAGPAPAAPSALPTAVSAGYAAAPRTSSTPGDDHTNAIVLGAFALLVASGAGFVTFCRLRG